MSGLILTFFIFSGLFAQSIDISGSYLDKQSNPIPDAMVLLIHSTDTLSESITATEGDFSLTITPVVAISESQNIFPENYSLSQNYPNPFNPSTRFTVQTLKTGSVSIYSITGHLIDHILLNQTGSYTLEWGGSDRFGRLVSAGLYVYVLSSGSVNIARKMLLLDNGSGGVRLHIISNNRMDDFNYKQSDISTLDKCVHDDTPYKLIFNKLNTSQINIEIEQLLSDTTLNVIVGNPGPTLKHFMPDTVVPVGDTLLLNLNDYIDNDELLQLTTNDTSLQVIQDTLIQYIAMNLDTLAARITETDRTDQSMNVSLDFNIYSVRSDSIRFVNEVENVV